MKARRGDAPLMPAREESTRTACLGGILGIFVMLTLGLTALLVVGAHTQHTGGEVFASAALSSPDGSVGGEFDFLQQQMGGVLIAGHVTGLAPYSRHGMSIQTYAEGGGTFNPRRSPHSCPDDGSRRAGDLGNVQADAQGTAYYHRVDQLLALGGKHSAIGRVLVLHAQVPPPTHATP